MYEIFTFADGSKFPKDCLNSKSVLNSQKRNPFRLLAITLLLLLFLIPAGAIAQSQTFNNSSGTFIVPAGVNKITVECWGGGGRGATRTAFQGVGGGGGGGAYSRKVFTVNPSDSFSYTAGAGSSSAAAGGDSWFGTITTVFAKGGASGSGVTGGAGGSLGSGFGDFTSSGGNGSNTGGGGGSGGSALNGNNGSGNTGAVAVAGGAKGGNGGAPFVNGQNGDTPGGGGGSASNASTPGSGGAGQVKVSWAIPIISSFAPSSICAVGDHTVALTGTNFTGATVVTFNGVDAQSFVVNSNTSITAIAPNGVTTGNIAVTRLPDGIGTSSSALVVKSNPVVAPITNGGVTLCTGGTVDLNDTTPAGTWSTSNPSVASVDGNGIVTAIAGGSATISYSITDNGCTTAQTTIINVNAAIVSGNPISQSVVTGSTTIFSVMATGAIASFQWRVSTDGGDTFTDLVDDAVYSGTSTATLTISNTPSELNESLFDVVIAALSPCATFISESAALTVGDVGISLDPVAVTLCSSGAGIAIFDVTAVGTVNSYSWEEDQGLGFFPLSDGTLSGVTYAGTSTSQLTLSGLGVAETGWSYRAVANGVVNMAISNGALLTVREGIVVTSAPIDQTICYSGGSGSFTVGASGATEGIQWQYSTNGVTFSNVLNGVPAGVTYTGATSNTLNFTTSAATPPAGTYFYRANISATAPCTDVASVAAQLHIYTPVISSQPANATVAAGNNTSYTVTTAEPSPSFQWQYATAVGGPYANVVNNTPAGATYSGANSGSLTVTLSGSATASSARFYRAVVTSGGCSVTSAAAQMTIVTYCTPTSLLNDTANTITNVVLSNTAQGTNYTQASSGAAPWFTFYGNPPLVITQGQNMSIAMTFGTDGTQFSAIWVDYNRNGTFEAAENVALASSAAGANATVTYNFVIPFTASPGITRVRVSGANNSAYAANTPCGTALFGETEDYLIEVLAAPACSGNPVVGIAASNISTICNSGTATLSVTGYATGFTGLSFQWYNTVNGPIAGATGTSYTTPVLVAQASYYVRLSCLSGGFTDSNIVSIGYQNPTVDSTAPDSRCGPGSITIGATPSSGATIKWYAAATGGSPLFTGNNFTIPNLASTTTFYAEANILTCLSAARTPVIATINPGPTLTLNGTGSPICAGSTTALVTLTAGLADYDTFTWSPQTNISGTAAAGYTFNPSVTTTYTLNAVNNTSGCNRSVTYTVTVDPMPTALLVTPATVTVCSNAAPALLTSSGGIINNVPILTEDFNNSAPLWVVTNGGSSPAAANWAYQTAPYTDAAGNATFLNFTTPNGGKFAMAQPEAGGALTSTNTVLTSPAFSTVGYSSATLTFEHAYRSYAIDGTVALQISTNGGGSWTNLVNYLGTSVGSTTNNAQTTVAATVSLNAFLNQPNLKIRYNYTTTLGGNYWLIDNVKVTGTDPGKVTWSPVAGLFTNAAGTIAYTGTPAATIYAMPASATVYTATATALTTCAVTTQVTVNGQIAENWYADADGDTYGNIASTYFGCTQPGYVTDATDCDDSNAAIYQSGTFFVDGDGDGYGNGAQATICYGATIPFGYTAVSLGLDCNDAIAAINPGHVEVLYNGVDDNCDGQLDEGHQIVSQIQPVQCGTTLVQMNSLISAISLPQCTSYRFEVTNTDTNLVQVIVRGLQFFSLDMLASYDYATTYSIRVELQRNGVWLGYYGPSCLVSSPAVLAPNGAAQITPSQCGITLPSVSTLISTTSLAGVTSYRFRITNISDLTAPNQVQTIDRPLQWFSLTMLPTFNYGTTYLIEVAVKTNGVFSGFGSPCQITAPQVPSIDKCGQTIATPAIIIHTVSLAKVTAYRFELTNLVTNQVITIDRAVHYFTFNNIPGFAPSTSYGVRVAVMTSGAFSLFGDACEIISPGFARPDSVKPEHSQPFTVAASPNPFIDGFALRVNGGEGELAVKVYDMTGKLIESFTDTSQTINNLSIGDRYPSGVYNVVVGEASEVRVLRVIKR